MTERLTFQEIEPGIAYEYAVLRAGRRIGRVRKQEATSWPYKVTGRWIADDGRYQGVFVTRREAAEWLDR